jgi:hypothetical protein
MATRVLAWEKCSLCECGDQVRLSIYEGCKFFHCPSLWPDLKVSISLLQISLVMTISLLIYLTHILSCVHGSHVSLEDSLTTPHHQRMKEHLTNSNAMSGTTCTTRSTRRCNVNNVPPPNNDWNKK